LVFSRAVGGFLVLSFLILRVCVCLLGCIRDCVSFRFVRVMLHNMVGGRELVTCHMLCVSCAVR